MLKADATLRIRRWKASRDTHMDPLRNFDEVKRVVVKVGTNVLSSNGAVDEGFLDVIADQISALRRTGRQVILVTSGAIGMGAGALSLRRPVKTVKLRQACAAVGQGILMHAYRQAFGRFGQQVAQVLLTNSILANRKHYVNLKNAVETLLSMDVVPIVNENDCVSIAEIDLAFGDNDKLSALVASKIDAELLILLTDVDGLYDANPRRNAHARLIPTVYEVTEEIDAMAGHAGSHLGTGGMKTKLGAIRIAAQGGCKVVLANGRAENVIARVLAGENVGTLFMPNRRLSNRRRWILNSPVRGRLEIDAGAREAILAHRSLLAVGIRATEGTFRAGDVVAIGDVAKGVCGVSSAELQPLISGQAPSARKAVVHVDNIVLL
jgi:glutamate 5-kinase